MKEGWIVWNMTNYNDGYEFFGVYKSYKAALKQLRKVVRNRYGKCPRDEKAMWDFIYSNREASIDCEDALQITHFSENDG